MSKPKAKPRARILDVDIRRRISSARIYYRETGGKCILDVPDKMIDIRALMSQLADDAERLLGAIEAERGGRL